MDTPTENENNGKQQFPFVSCKQKTETANFSFFTANGKRKWNFVFLGRQTINGNRRLLFQQTCPSMHKGTWQNIGQEDVITFKGRQQNIGLEDIIGRNTSEYWTRRWHNIEHEDTIKSPEGRRNIRQEHGRILDKKNGRI